MPELKSSLGEAFPWPGCCPHLRVAQAAQAGRDFYLAFFEQWGAGRGGHVQGRAAAEQSAGQQERREEELFFHGF